MWAILAHLSIPARTAAARRLRMRLDDLSRQGLLATRAPHGVPAWRLSPAGRRLLRRAERSRRPPRLPESPQHLAWRSARRAARQELPRFRARLAGSLADAGELVADGTADSDEWLLLGRRLQRDCWLLGSAWHCLHEWREPPEDRADRDAAGSGPLASLRAGRRNLALWPDPERPED